MAPQFQSPAPRFWSKVNFNGPGGCWEWTACLFPAGYGKFGVRSPVVVGAHRWSYEAAYGSIPDGLCVCHRCDNRKCVRPDHLFLGTVGDNNRDMYAKGRNNNPTGADHPKTKLSTEQVLEVRRMLRDGMPVRQIAERFGVFPGTIYAIRNGKSHKKVVLS
jgi:hypothetical protein